MAYVVYRTLVKTAHFPSGQETNPENYLKLLARGEVDGSVLEALEDYVKRQKLPGIDPQKEAVN